MSARNMVANPLRSSKGMRQPPPLPAPVRTSTPNMSNTIQSSPRYARLRACLRKSTSTCSAAGRITRNQKNAPKPTTKIVASNDSGTQERIVASQPGDRSDGRAEEIQGQRDRQTDPPRSQRTTGRVAYRGSGDNDARQSGWHVGYQSEVVGDSRSAESRQHPHRAGDAVNHEPDEEPINPAGCVAEANRLRRYYLCIHFGYLWAIASADRRCG